MSPRLLSLHLGMDHAPWAQKEKCLPFSYEIFQKGDFILPLTGVSATSFSGIPSPFLTQIRVISESVEIAEYRQLEV